MSTLTTFYNYSDGNESEFVFSCKGRPFTSLISTFLPTPSSTLIDYGLVKDLNLKMTDLQCQKFHYGGYKMRILGHVEVKMRNQTLGLSQGCAKTRVFHQKPSPVGLTGLNRVLMGFMG